MVHRPFSRYHIFSLIVRHFGMNLKYIYTSSKVAKAIQDCQWINYELGKRNYRYLRLRTLRSTCILLHLIASKQLMMWSWWCTNHGKTLAWLLRNKIMEFPKKKKEKPKKGMVFFAPWTDWASWCKILSILQLIPCKIFLFCLCVFLGGRGGGGEGRG